MAEKILFNLPIPADGEEQAHEILWYQSDNGITWDVTPVDTILVSNLILNVPTGKYEWDSALVDPLRYHYIKSRGLSGIESINGFILAPRPTPSTTTSYYALKQEDGAEALYDIGDTVDLALRVDLIDTIDLGETIDVEIKDIFDNVITTLTAELLNDTYIASWDIPLSLHRSYNVHGVTDTSQDQSLYYLTDNWIFPDGVMSFDFSVKRAQESPIRDNCSYEVTLSNLETVTHGALGSYSFKFTSTLNPYYCSVDDVLTIHPEYLSKLDHLEIAKSIIDWSYNADMHLRPDNILYQQRYDNAVKNWVAYNVAYAFLSSGPLDVSAESKDLDGFKIYRQYDRDQNSGIHRYINENIEFYELIILSGGLDTPYVSKTFIKGIFDPNRPNTSRSNLDISDFYPWVNESSKNMVITDSEGRQIELKGTRTIAYRWRHGFFTGSYGASGSMNSYAMFSATGDPSQIQETMY